MQIADELTLKVGDFVKVTATLGSFYGLLLRIHDGVPYPYIVLHEAGVRDEQTVETPFSIHEVQKVDANEVPFEIKNMLV